LNDKKSPNKKRHIDAPADFVAGLAEKEATQEKWGSDNMA